MSSVPFRRVLVVTGDHARPDPTKWDGRYSELDGIGFEALPPLEVDYSGLPEGLPEILAFESKTTEDTPYTRVGIRPARLSPLRVETLRTHATVLFERLRCRDYARFDFRTDARGEIELLEVNPNPAWDCEAKLALMAGFADIPYPDLLGKILDAARRRLTGGAAGS